MIQPFWCHLVVCYKANMQLPYNSSVLTHLSQRNENFCLFKNLYPNIYSIFIQNSQYWKYPEIFQQMSGQINCSTHMPWNTLLNKKEWSTNATNNLGEFLRIMLSEKFQSQKVIYNTVWSHLCNDFGTCFFILKLRYDSHSIKFTFHNPRLSGFLVHSQCWAAITN